MPLKGYKKPKQIGQPTSSTHHTSEIAILRLGTLMLIGNNYQIHEQDWDKVMLQLESGKPCRVVFQATQRVAGHPEEVPTLRKPATAALRTQQQTAPQTMTAGGGGT